ncbi:MAG: alpha/beta fold hydrolase [Pseudonocardia sp.]|nr:alpha/beta fold hydrolase [Pseudonocardia sp.]
MRASEPDRAGHIERDGVRVAYEVTGDGHPALLLLPSLQIVHSRQWKAQVPYLARHYTVITFDARGNGHSDRPTTADAYGQREIVADAIAVLDAVGVERAAFVGTSMGALYGLEAAAWYADRVLAVVAIGAVAPFIGPVAPGQSPFYDLFAIGSIAGYNQQHGIGSYREFTETFVRAAVTEPHRTKSIEDAVGFGLETTAEVLELTAAAPGVDGPGFKEVCRAVRCPVLLVHGDQDGIIPYDHGVRLAELLGVVLVTIEGGGHALPFGDPVRCNLLIREFVDGLIAAPPGPQRWRRARDRRRRVLYVCSPIGLGHVRRDLAISEELRALHPDVEIDWLTQEPVCRVLTERGERVHPAARWLASESAHVEAEAGEHDLHAFQTFRRMDEILVANFMVFHDLMSQEHYDLVVADEGWDVDYFLHENPELKRSPFAWLTDFVGFLPMPEGGAAEASLTADHNAEMIEQVARYPRLRDRSIFVGDREDLVDDPLGPDLPSVRSWTEANFAFAGQVAGVAPPEDREALRAELGYRPGEPVCLVTVGGTGVGASLLRRAVQAFPMAARHVPGLRLIVVAGPRIDPSSIAAPPGVEVRAYVPDLHRALVACDIAVVQGGLTTTMELVAAQRPFLYFPLARHFEQQIHVPHRLRRYRAGRRMDYASTDPDQLAEAIADELDRPVGYRPVDGGGARRAAALLAELL